MIHMKEETLAIKNSRHIEVLNHEMGELRDAQKEGNKKIGAIRSDFSEAKMDIATVKTDVDWLKRFFFIVAGASVGSLITSVFQLLK